MRPPNQPAGTRGCPRALRLRSRLISPPAAPPHHRWARETEGWTWYSWLSFYVPIFGWIRTYNWRAWLVVSCRGVGCHRLCGLRTHAAGKLACPVSVLLTTEFQMHCHIIYSRSPHMCALQWDVAAGMSTAAMVIPQGMSYANLAGLPYAYGLYGAFVPCIVYALFGSSRQLVGCWQPEQGRAPARFA